MARSGILRVHLLLVAGILGVASVPHDANAQATAAGGASQSAGAANPLEGASKAGASAKPRPTPEPGGAAEKPRAGAPDPNAEPKEAEASTRGAAAASAGGAEQLAAAENDPYRKLAAELDDSSAAIDELRSKVATAQPEVREALNSQLHDLLTGHRRALVDAAAVLTGAKPPDGTDDAKQALRALLASKLTVEARELQRELEGLEKSIVGMTSKANKAKGDEKADLVEKRNVALEQLPDLLGQLHDNLTARASLKQNVDADVARLKRFLANASKHTSGMLKGIAAELERAKEDLGAELSPEQRAEIAELNRYRSLVADVQRREIEIMDDYGMDTVQQRQDLITATGEISQEILDADVATGLLRKWRGDVVAAIKQHASDYFFRAVTFVVIVLAFMLLGRICKGLVRRGLARPGVKISSLAGDFFVTMTGRVIWVAGFVVAVAQLGIEVAPLLAGLGIAGFVIGFALQDTLSNFASGMMILMYRPFDVGDVVEAAGVMGKVEAMNLVSTSVLTFDNQMLVVPNSKIWGDVIRNVTHQRERRVDLTFGIGYDDDIEHAERVLASILEGNPRVLKEPAAAVKLHELGDSSVNFVVRPWVKTEDYWDAYWEITREVKRRFDAEGISIPFPQRDVHVYEERLAARPSRESSHSDVAPTPGVGRA